MGSQNCYEEFEPYAIAIIRRKARQLGRQLGCCPEDMEQELALDLYLRLRRYDPSRLPKHTFMSQILEHKAASIAEYAHAQMRDRRREERSLDEPVRTEEGAGGAPFRELFDSEVGRDGLRHEDLCHLRADLAAVMERLPVRQRRLVELLLAEFSVRRAAQELGIHHSTAYEDLVRVRERFRRAGLHEYLKINPTHPGRQRY